MAQAVISDIHGNLTAFLAVLDDIDRLGVTDLICLGDCIGYGPQPHEVLALIRERGIPCVLGNHELGIVDPSFRSWFNPNSLKVLDLTRSMLSDNDLTMLRTWPRVLLRDGCRYVHGCPPDSVSEYLYEYEDGGLGELCRSFSERVCFIGHTHELQLIRCSGADPDLEVIGMGRYRLDSGRYIVNIGSVGQPRDGDNRAKYVLFEPDTGKLEVRAVKYDIKAVADRILRLGFPETFARRLW